MEAEHLREILLPVPHRFLNPAVRNPYGHPTAAFTSHWSTTELLMSLHNFTTTKNKYALPLMWRWKKLQVYGGTRSGIHHNHFCFFKRQLNTGHRLNAVLLGESLAQNELVSPHFNNSFL